MSQIRQAILKILGQYGPLSVHQIAPLIGSSVMATRYHLAVLVVQGAVTVSGVVPRTSAGRPALVYTLSGKAYPALPQQYDTLALHLLDEVREMLGEKGERTLLQRVGRRLAATAPGLSRATRVETRLRRATAFLNQRGYLTRWQKSDDVYLLSIGHCPYRHVALTHRQVCAMDMALVSQLLQMPLRLVHCIAYQDSQCVFLVKPRTHRP